MKEEEEELVVWDEEIEIYNIDRDSPTIDIKSWYAIVCQYLEHGTIPSHVSTRQNRALKIKALSYQLVHGMLFIKHHNWSTAKVFQGCCIS